MKLEGVWGGRTHVRATISLCLGREAAGWDRCGDSDHRVWCPPDVSAVLCRRSDTHTVLLQAGMAPAFFCWPHRPVLSFCPISSVLGPPHLSPRYLVNPTPLKLALSPTERVHWDCGVPATSQRSQTLSTRLCCAPGLPLM